MTLVGKAGDLNASKFLLSRDRTTCSGPGWSSGSERVYWLVNYYSWIMTSGIASRHNQLAATPWTNPAKRTWRTLNVGDTEHWSSSTSCRPFDRTKPHTRCPVRTTSLSRSPSPFGRTVQPQPLPQSLERAVATYFKTTAHVSQAAHAHWP